MKNNPLHNARSFRTGKDLASLLNRGENNSATLDVSPPSNETESTLYVIWKNLLGHNNFGVKDDFFQIGGNSLKAVQLVSRIFKDFSVHIQLTEIFLQPTIEKLAVHILSQDKSSLSSSIIPIQKRPDQIPLSFSQERLWFIDQLEGSVQYNLSDVFRLRGEFSKEALEYGLSMIVDRHEILRTVIREEHGKPYQYIKEKGRWHLNVVDGHLFQNNALDLKQYIDKLIKEPFDLSKDDMIRAHLIILNKQAHILVVTIHHIASDGWSLSIFTKELVELYGYYINEPIALPEPLKLQYADYAIWQRQHLQGELLNRKISYWKEKLKGVSPLQLPTDYIRPTVQSTKGALKNFNIDKELSGRLVQLSNQQSTTLFMTLLAAFKILMHRYSSQQDICVGTPIANRAQQELEELIGFFVNTLAIRSEVKSDASFVELLQQVKLTTLEAYEYQDVPFEKVVEVVVKERDLGRNPLFQVMLVMQNTPEVQELGLGEVQLSVEGYTHETTKFDISIFITETVNGLQGAVEYATGLYNEATIERMLGHFKILLSSIIEQPQQKIGELRMLTPEEELQLLYKFNNTKVDYPKEKTIVNLFEAQAASTPEAIAVVFEEEQLTYKQLNERANQLAYYLRDKGVKEETLVPICIERSIEMIVGILGILKSGGAYVPVDPEYPQERISYMLEDTGATIAVSSKNIRSKLKIPEGIEVIELDTDWKAMDNQSAENLQISVEPHHLAYVIYTSGSTGKPKGVMNEHKGLVNRLRWAQDYYVLNSEDAVLQKTTFSFDVSVWELLWTLLAGAKLVFAKPGGHRDSDYLKSTIEKEKITLLHFVPSMLEVFLPDVQKGDCKSIQKVLCSGEALQPSQVALFEKKLPHVKLYNLYGPTEAAIDVTYWSISDKEKTPGIIPIGKPVANTQIYILNNCGEVVPIGIAGELNIGGIQVARGYLNQSELTAEKFIANPFSIDAGSRLYKTGDLARWLPDGNLEYLGRMDNQVKIRGYRIELGEIESILQQFGGVAQGVVLAKQDNCGTKQLVGYVVAKETFDKEAIITYLKSKLPAYMIPAVWVELEGLPLTSNGKIDRKALRDPENTELRDQYIGPRNNAESKLVKIWTDLLHVERIGIHDNFFELGGHSLLAMRVISALRKKLNVEMSIKDMFQYTTISDLSEYIKFNYDFDEEFDTTSLEEIKI